MKQGNLLCSQNCGRGSAEAAGRNRGTRAKVSFGGWVCRHGQAAGLGIGFGAFGDLLATSSSLAEADTSVVNDAQAAAGAALLALTIALVAAAIGGAVGAKMWPRRDDTIDLRDRHRVR